MAFLYGSSKVQAADLYHSANNLNSNGLQATYVETKVTVASLSRN